MEPRGAIAEYDAEEERFHIRCTFQSALGPVRSGAPDF